MTRGDVIGLVLSYVYAFGMLLVVEGTGRRLNWPQFITRKIIHIGAGLWIWGILALFDTWYIGIIPFGTFIILNAIFYRRQVFQAMDDEESTPGTIYFAISITVLFGLLWRTGGQPDRVVIAAAAVMAMTLGDGMAAIVGHLWGKREYTFFGHVRTWEGVGTMVVFSLLGIGLTLLLVPGSLLSPNSIALSPLQVGLMTVLGTGVAALAEGTSPRGTDNLSVPLLSGLVMFLLTLV